MIRSIKIDDAKAIKEIYNYYIENTIITFEESPVSLQEMEDRINKTKDNFAWIVYEENNQVVGYAYASPWQPRSAYRYSALGTVYLKVGFEKKGIGTKLYSYLISILKKTDLEVLIGGLSIPNEGSQTLHKKLGFKKVAHFEKVGWKFDKWIDVAYWQLFLKE